MQVRELLASFDEYLAKRELRLDAIIIGGAALNLLGIVSRFTKDCDILYPEIPKEVADAACAFAADVRQVGETLQNDWLNNGPVSLAGHLRPLWEQRLQTVFTGKAIHLRCLGR